MTNCQASVSIRNPWSASLAPILPTVWWGPLHQSSTSLHQVSHLAFETQAVEAAQGSPGNSGGWLMVGSNAWEMPAWQKSQVELLNLLLSVLGCHSCPPWHENYKCRIFPCLAGGMVRWGSWASSNPLEGKQKPNKTTVKRAECPRVPHPHPPFSPDLSAEEAKSTQGA